MKKPVLPPTVFLALLIATMTLSYMFKNTPTIPVWIKYIGAILIIAGTVFNLWTDKTIKKASTTVKPHETPSVLIKDGPFSFSRNPMYLGMSLILLGAALSMQSLAAILTTPIFIVICELYYIPIEEKNCINSFGDEYREYASRVRKWI